MKRIVRLTESDLTRIVRRVIKENELSTFEGSANPMEFIYAPGMGLLASLDNLDPIAQKRGETEDIYNRFEVEFQNGDSDIEYIEFGGGRYGYDMESPKIMKMLNKIENFVSNPDSCAFLIQPRWLASFLKSTDKLYIVKYYGDLYEESEF